MKNQYLYHESRLEEEFQRFTSEASLQNVAFYFACRCPVRLPLSLSKISETKQ